MADISYIFQDTATNLFIDWDCVWRDWVYKVFDTVSADLKDKYFALQVGFWFISEVIAGEYFTVSEAAKYTVKDVGDKYPAVDKK